MKKSFLALALAVVGFNSFAGGKNILFIAGAPSHGPAQHEHRAGCLLLKSCLDNVPGVGSHIYTNGWTAVPDDAFEGVDAIVVYSDGGGGHPLLQGGHLKKMDELMKNGVGLVCLHYATEPTIEKGQKEFLEWIGGAFEINWSVNPHWDADFKKIPKHPITSGVKPFTIRDEWYFHIRFPDGMKGVTPILSAVPTSETTNRVDGTHSGNPAMRKAVKAGESQVTAWAFERPGGGRGFGFTGGHFHKNWGDDNFRKVVLNAILWAAKIDVPAGGVPGAITEKQLEENLDPKGPRKK